jgi:uncharacterized membrane protein YecN with MAPEG domain
MHLLVSPLYFALAALLFLYLSMQVSLTRRRHRVALGDGGQPELLRAIRVHGNFAEFVPLALLLLLAIDLQDHEKWIVHVLGIALIVARVLHAHGLSRHAGESFGRAAGAGLTYLVLIAGAVLAILGFLGTRL